MLNYLGLKITLTLKLLSDYEVKSKIIKCSLFKPSILKIGEKIYLIFQTDVLNRWLEQFD